MTGGETITEVRKTINEITEILGSGGFHLNKWISNEVSLLNEITNTMPDSIINIGHDN